MPYITITAETEAELEERIARYLRRWHPMGYGTTVRDKIVNPDDGIFTAFIWRADSCD